ncbi:MAG: aminotransferase class V-fold PLP-dependent enzyme, partial [Clostridiales bacterium]
GGQEKRLRSGTENLPGIVGMGLAAEITKKTMADFIPQYKQLRDHFMSRVLNEVPFSRLNGHPIERLPHNANLSFDYIEGEALLLHLDLQGIACSAGSACSSSSLEPSHVLKAMNLDPKWAHSALRFTLGLGNDLAQMDYAVDVIKDKVALLRKASPFYNENHFQGKKSAHGGK